ncbi:auxin response factor 16-like [Cornus florida]|uniref:auxin response factor 16-like n=1 Tax=Cornus florida TaxID=4283 RepID=UPI00289E8768|nr:auxin response factor 16-like [Cornus florida]
MGDLDEAEVLLDPRIWIECAGVMARVPAVGSHVCYFVEGHAENVGFQTRGLPHSMVRCRVIDVRLLSNSEEVLAKIHLFPVNDEVVNDEGGNMIFDAEDRLLSAAKVLSNSDVTSKFTVTQHCINHIFPKLVPPETSQMIPTHDVHGRSWVWRHTCKSKGNKGGFN